MSTGCGHESAPTRENQEPHPESELESTAATAQERLGTLENFTADLHTESFVIRPPPTSLLVSERPTCRVASPQTAADVQDVLLQLWLWMKQ